MDTTSPPTRLTFQEQVLEQLGLDICAGRYQPGDILPAEQELCDRFTFSRIVIREAIKSLVAKGMLEVRRKAGTQVLEPSHWNLFDPAVMAWRAKSSSLNPQLSTDLMELRRIIEPAAARLAAKRATRADHRALRTAYELMERAIAGEGDYVKADLIFHAAVLQACGNQFVCQMQEAMSAILRTSFEMSLKRGGPAFSLPMHEALCSAIENGDMAAAERAAMALIDQAEKDLIERMQETSSVTGSPESPRIKQEE